MLRAYKAKWIVTASSDVLENHMLIVDDGQVIDIIPSDDENKYNLQKVKDFGNAVITPGFVNLLAHLQYGKSLEQKPQTLKNKIKSFVKAFQLKYDMAGLPQKGYANQMATLYKKYFCSDRKQKISSFKTNLKEAILSGTTCVAQVSKENKYFEILNQMPIKTYLFFELFADSLNSSKSEFKNTRKKIENLIFNKSANTFIGVAPHSISCVHKKLWKILSKYCRKNNLLMLIHFAECFEEQEWLEHGFSDIDMLHKFLGLRKLSPYQKELSAIEYLEKLDVLSKKVILANANQLTRDELFELAKTEAKFVYCPRFSDKLIGKKHTLADVKNAFGENFAFGTDSLYFNDDLNLLNEVKSANENVMNFAETIKHLTIYPARILRLQNIIGSLEKDKHADFNVFELADGEDYTAILNGKKPIHVYTKGRKLVRNYNLISNL